MLKTSFRLQYYLVSVIQLELRILTIAQALSTAFNVMLFASLRRIFALFARR